MNANFTSCILCNSSGLENLDEYSQHYLVQCRKCGFVFSQRIATEEELIKFYSRYHINEPLSLVTMKRYDEWLDNLEAYRLTNNLLDIGSGDGYFLERAKQRGWNTYGTEFTQRQAEVAEAKGIRMHKGILNPANYSPGLFDAITSIEVIEHINNPNDEVRKINSILRTGGVVYVTTPNFNALSRYYFKNRWNIFAYPEHLSYYTRSTLSRLFRSNGFKVSRFESTGISLKRYKQSSTGDRSTIFTIDEKVRQRTEDNLIFKSAKKIINFFLTLTNKGDTLKGLFVKEHDIPHRE